MWNKMKMDVNFLLVTVIYQILYFLVFYLLGIDVVGVIMCISEE